MARKKREWYPGATYHVMSRGNRRAAIFQDQSDYLHFLECLRVIRDKYPFTIHAICLMTNHFHMLLTMGSTELWRVMQKLLSVYAEQFNHKYHFTGHLFEGRYASCIIEDERYFLEVSRYIHLNPVKAQMVREPLTYEYSSYATYMSIEEKENNGESSGMSKVQSMITNLNLATYMSIEEKENNGESSGMSKVQSMITNLTDTSRVLGAFRHNSIEQYRMFVEGKISHAEQELLIMKDMKEDEMWLPWG